VTMFHYDAAEMEAGIASLEREQKVDAPGALGVQSRLQFAVLRPFYETFLREINAGVSVDDMQKAVAGLISNMVLAIVDSATNAEEPQRTAELRRMMVLIGWCTGEVKNMPHGTVQVRGHAGGRA
jgi:hypothetical protein